MDIHKHTILATMMVQRIPAAAVAAPLGFLVYLSPFFSLLQFRIPASLDRNYRIVVSGTRCPLHPHRTCSRYSSLTDPLSSDYTLSPYLQYSSLTDTPSNDYTPPTVPAV